MQVSIIAVAIIVSGLLWPRTTARLGLIIGALLTFILLIPIQIYSILGNSLIVDIADTRARVDNLMANAASAAIASESLSNHNTQPLLGKSTLAHTPASAGDKIMASDELISALSFLVSYHDSLQDWLEPLEKHIIKPFMSAYQIEEPVPLPGCVEPGYKERSNYTAAQMTLCISPCLPKDKPGDRPLLREMGWLRIKEETLAEEDLITARFIQQTFQMFLLPFLYGLLGALMYVLRKLYEETETGSLVPPRSVKKYFLRLPMGALSGVAIAWISNPSDGSGIRSLQPYALAFVAGYGVEVLFSGLDRLVGAFSPASAVSQGSDGTAGSKV